MNEIPADPLSDVPYIRWAKSDGGAGEHNLTMSAVSPVDWDDIDFDPRDLRLFDFTPYGPDEVLETVAGEWQLEPSSILLGASASHAHFCLAASILEPGDRVVHEVPGYLPLLDALSLLRIEPLPFERRFEDRYRLDVAGLMKKVVEVEAKLVLLTDLHNPSGVHLGEDVRRALAQMCEKTGVMVICDEMYRPFLDPDPGPLSLLHPRIVSIGGLNKVHGLSQIRVGWGIASAEVVERARRIIDSTTLHNSCLTDQVAVAAMGHLDSLRQRGRDIARGGWQLMEAWYPNSPLEVVAPAAGLVSFPQVPQEFGDGDRLRSRLLDAGVNVTPGRFFGSPGHVRIGHGLPAVELARALVAIDGALSP